MDAQLISVIALVVSLVSLGFSAYFGLRDRASLKATSRFSPAWEGNTSASMSVSIVNAGRRPIILRVWQGADADGRTVGTFFAYKKNGLRLEEHERHDFMLRKEDLYATTPDDDVVMADMWIETNLGKKYKIKDAKANIAKLWAS